MVFVKFHNMKQEKIFFNAAFKLKQTFFFTNFHFTSQNNIAITVHKCSAFLFFSSMYCLFFLKNVCSFLSFFFLCAVFNSVQISFFFFLVSFHCPVPFFKKKIIINCSFTILFFFFFFNLISASLCLYLNSITIGSLPSLFNFNPFFH